MEDPIITINFNTLFLNPDNVSVYVVLFSLIVISYSIMPCGTHTFQCAFLNVGRYFCCILNSSVFYYVFWHSKLRLIKFEQECGQQLLSKFNFFWSFEGFNYYWNAIKSLFFFCCFLPVWCTNMRNCRLKMVAIWMFKSLSLNR